MSTPCKTAHAVMAMLASRRSSGGAGLPSGRGASRPRKDFRLAPITTGNPVPTSSVEVPEEHQVVVPALAEADAGVDPHLGDTPADRGRAGALHQILADLGHHVVIAGIRLHHGGVRRHVHGDPSDAQLGGDGPQGGGHVVDDGGAGADGRPGHRRLARVDRHPDPGPGQALDDRQHPAELLGLGHRPGPGPGRFAPDVQDVGSICDHLPTVPDGGCRHPTIDPRPKTSQASRSARPSHGSRRSGYWERRRPGGQTARWSRASPRFSGRLTGRTAFRDICRVLRDFYIKIERGLRRLISAPPSPA